MTEINLRPSLARHLQQRLRAFEDGFRHNLALLGPPGSGKTFQLQQLMARQPSRTLLIYCPIYRESCRTFVHRFLCAIMQAGLGPSDSQSLELLLTQGADALPNTVAAVRPIEPLLARRAYGEAFNRALDVIPVLSRERGQPSLVILDEFLFLEDLGLGHAFHELGKRVMTWPCTLFVLSSSSPYRARNILRERLQLLFGQFELLTLDGFEKREAGMWVQRELRSLRGVKALGPFLIWWLDTYPWYLGVVLKRFKELATLRGAVDVTEALFVESVWDVLGSPEGSLHQWCVSRIEPLSHVRHGPRAIEALLQIADGARTTTEIGKRMGRAGLAGSLQVLVEHDLAQRNGMCWVVSDPVQRCWLSTILWAQRCGIGLDMSAVRRRFERYLQALWGQWVLLQQRSLAEQVAGLFTQFSDETVCLEQKTGRLPRFRHIETRGHGRGRSAYLLAEGEGKQWCCSVAEELVTEQGIASFEAFCRTQRPRPSRKVVVAKEGLDENAKLLAKASNMWVWGSRELEVLADLYAHPLLEADPPTSRADRRSASDSEPR